MDNFTIKQLGVDDWQIWKNFRVGALKNSPESFGSSYEEELNWKNSDFQNSLTCVTINLGAVEFYQKQGFKIYGEEPNSLKIENQYFNEYIMVLVL